MKKGLMILVLVALVASMVAPVFAEDAKVTGTVEKTDAGLVLKADDGDYAVTGTAVTEAMVGKKVEVTGAVTEAEGKKSIEAKEAKEVQ